MIVAQVLFSVKIYDKASPGSASLATAMQFTVDSLLGELVVIFTLLISGTLFTMVMVSESVAVSEPSLATATHFTVSPTVTNVESRSIAMPVPSEVLWVTFVQV